MNMANVEPITATIDKHKRRYWTFEILFATLEVLGQYCTGGWVDGHEPPAAELGGADRQDGLFKIDITKLQIQCLGDAQTRHAE